MQKYVLIFLKCTMTAYIRLSSVANLKDPMVTQMDLLQMAEGQAEVPENLLADTIDAAEECHGECIFIEVD